MQEEYPDIPMAIKFPKERIMGEYRAYFTNHVAWMIALAMTEGVTHFGVFGCEYAHVYERGHQRGSLEYWLGMFEGRGGHVILPPQSHLLNKPFELYGYESHHPVTGKLIESYRISKDAGAPPALPGPPDMPELKLIDPKTAEGRIPLREIPGQPVEWGRSGHTIHK